MAAHEFKKIKCIFSNYLGPEKWNNNEPIKKVCIFTNYNTNYSLTCTYLLVQACGKVPKSQLIKIASHSQIISDCIFEITTPS